MKTRRHHKLNLLRSAVALLFASAFLSRCANMMTPTGGPRDSLPPVIVAMTPDNFTTNRPTVGHDKIYIEFDEFVQIKDQQKEFFTSPEMKKNRRSPCAAAESSSSCATRCARTRPMRSTSEAPSATTTRATRSIRCATSSRPVPRSIRWSSRAIRPTATSPTRSRRASSGSTRPTRWSISPTTTRRSSSTALPSLRVPRTMVSSSPRTSSRSPTGSMPCRTRTTTSSTSREPTRWVSSREPTIRPRCPTSPSGTTRCAAM